MRLRVSSVRTLVFCISILAVFAESAPWKAFRGNLQRSGFYASKIGVPDSSSGPLWKIKLGSAIISSPVVENRVLYVGCRDSCLYAIDVQTGEILWKIRTGGWVDSSPFIFQDRVIVGSRDGHIYMIGKESGEVLARVPAGLQLSSPAVYKKSVLSGLGPPINSFNAYNLETSSWKIVDTTWTLPLTQMSYSSPAIKGDIAVIGASNGEFYTVDASTGELLWKVKTKGGVYMSTPAIDGDEVFFAPGNYDEKIYAYSLGSDGKPGEELWQSGLSAKKSGALKKHAGIRPIPPMTMQKLMRQSPATRQKALEGLRKQGYGFTSMLVKRASGGAAVAWSPEGDVKTSSIAVDPKSVFVIQKQLGREVRSEVYRPRFALIALDRETGEQQWEFDEIADDERVGYTSSPVTAELIGGGRAVFFGWGEGRVFALKARNDGYDVLWKATVDGHVVSSPAISDGRLFFATTKGNLYAYALEEAADARLFKDSVFAYPNPVRGNRKKVWIQLSNLSEQADVVITVYNTAERPVVTLKETIPAFNRNGRIGWSLNNVANGMYFAKVTAKYVSGEKHEKWLKIAVIRK